MGYNYKKIKEELIEKKYAQGGLVALCQTNTRMGVAGAMGGLLGAALSNIGNKKYAITKVGEQLVFVPYTSKEIDYKSAFAYKKDKLKYVKVSGWGGLSSVKIETISGKKHLYSVTGGKKDLKAILEALQIPKK